MSRFSSSVRQDFSLHLRYGFYYAAAFITIVWIVILSFIPVSFRLAALILVLFTDLAVVGFYFLAGQVLFEKGEGTIFALAVTPLTFAEYLASKLITLTFMAWLISITVTIFAYGTRFNILLFTLAIAFTSCIALLAGLVSVSPHRSISGFILPSQLYFLALFAPVFYFLNWSTNPLFYLLPGQGSLLLLQAAFTPLPALQLVYAITIQLLWFIILSRLARARFEQHITCPKGEPL